MPIPGGRNDISIKLVSWPGRRLRGDSPCVDTRLARQCAFIDWNIHRLLFDDWSASVGGLRRDRGRTGLVVVCRVGVSAVVWLAGLLWVAGAGLGQFGLKALDVRLLVYLDDFRAIATLVGPQFRGKKCIGREVIVTIGHSGQAGVVSLYCFGCRGLASWGKASPCIVGRVWIDVTEWVCCLHGVSIY